MASRERPSRPSNPFGFPDDFLPNRRSTEIIAEYLVSQLQTDGVDFSDHALGLATGVLYTLSQNNRCVTYEQGKAHWIWNDELRCHIPCCSRLLLDGTWCGNGPLSDDGVLDGDCGDH